jgi:hypothetical protein
MMFGNEDIANPANSTTTFTTRVHNPAGEFEIAADFFIFFTCNPLKRLDSKK